MKCLIYYVIADFVNFSSDTLKMADILHYGIRYGNVQTGGMSPRLHYANECFI